MIIFIQKTAYLNVNENRNIINSNSLNVPLFNRDIVCMDLIVLRIKN